MKTIILLILIFTFGNAQGYNYFFSSSAGFDTRTAAEVQNPATLRKSISKLNTNFSTLLPGDSVLFKSGEIFDNSITVTKSGTCPTASGIAKVPTDYIIKIKDINGCRTADAVSLKINCLNK